VSGGAAAAAAGQVGIRRRLRRLAGPDGVIAGLAIDHRDNFRTVLERSGINGLGTPELRALKRALVAVLAPAATAIMLDAELGQDAFDSGAVPDAIGLIMPLEAQGYDALGDGRVTTLLADFSPDTALAYGADACKLLLPYRLDDAPSALRQDALVGECARACHALGLPLVVEPIAYRWSTESEAAYAQRLPELVIGAVVRLQPLGVDLFKLPFPVADPAAVDSPDTLAACQAVTAACAGTPWVLLGAGAPADAFVEQVRVAGSNGASGFLAGRGIWGAALSSDPEQAAAIARAVCLPLFASCRTVAERVARPLARPLDLPLDR
jgi:tagatose-1,6-bisphosphate aldolase